MVKHTLLKQARTLGTPSLGPSIPGMKSILGPIQLKGLTMVNSRPFSAPSAAKKAKVMRGEFHGDWWIQSFNERWEKECVYTID